MKFYRHWARATATVETPKRNLEITCFGGSPTSLDDAKREAAAVAARVGDAIRAGKTRGDYPYARGPLREEVLEEVVEQDRTLAVVTRNAYGSMVLNAAGALFADIDYPAQQFSLWKWIRGVLGGSKEDKDAPILERVHDYAEQNSGVGLRLYRTANGYRCLATHRLFDPSSAEAQDLLEALGSDPLYIRLCRGQESFRARLTPKFWRCGGDRPPARYPWAGTEQERQYRQWQTDYEGTIRGFSTCALIGSFGSPLMHGEVRRVIDLHDRIACNGKAPLA